MNVKSNGDRNDNDTDEDDVFELSSDSDESGDDGDGKLNILALYTRSFCVLLFLWFC